MRVLVVEDNPKLSAALDRLLREQGWAVDASASGYEAEEMAVAEPYDLIVLDVMLPDRSGVELCRTLRRRDVAIPVLMLTSLSSTKDKVDGLDAGADDYLTKPFEFDELLARARALLRRGRGTESDKLVYGDVELDLGKRTATRAGEKLEVSAKEFALLEFLVRNPDRVHSRMTITQKVWDMTYEPSSNVVDVYIYSLRKKVDRNFDTPLIHTVIGFGYRFGQPAAE